MRVTLPGAALRGFSLKYLDAWRAAIRLIELIRLFAQQIKDTKAMLL
jgi:hypothetical protein